MMQMLSTLSIVKGCFVLWLVISFLVYMFGFVVGVKNGYTYLTNSEEYKFNSVFKNIWCILLAGIVGGITVLLITNISLAMYVYFAIFDFVLKSKNKFT